MTQSTTNVTAEYDRRINAMTPAERVARGAVMFAMLRNSIARRLVAQRGTMSDDEIKWRVAMELYGSSDSLRPIIQEQIERVSS